MVKVRKVLRPVKYAPNDEYVIVTVLTSEGDEADIWVGGQLEVFYHKGRIKGFVKRPANLTPAP